MVKPERGQIVRALSFEEEVDHRGWTLRHGAVPGRARIAIPALKRAPGVKVRLEAALPGQAGITDASASDWSGTLLITFDPDSSAASIIAAIAGTLDGAAPAPANDDRPARSRPAVSARRSRANTPAPSGRRAARTDGNGNGDREASSADWHLRPIGEVARGLDSDPENGLGTEEALRRLEREGRNELRPAKRRSRLAQLGEQFASLPVVLLLGSAGISIATGGIADAIAIVGIVGINAAIGYFTERQADRTIAQMVQPSTTRARVLRDGGRNAISETELVPGDVVMLQPGHYVPADARLISVESLTVDESALTGESQVVRKKAGTLSGPRVPLADRHNMVFKGTVVTGGVGRALVIGTGMYTEIGRIQALADTASAPQTPSQRQLDRLGRQLVVVSAAVCAAVFGAGVLHGVGLLPMLKSSIALAVAAVPEGLPAMAVSTLALGIRDMRKRGVLVRRLPAVETLGSVQTICLDKTGTITQNRMSVTEIRTQADTVRLRDRGFFKGGSEASEEAVDPVADPALRGLLKVGVLCSEARLHRHGGNEVLEGSSTEAALLRAAGYAGLDARQLREEHPRGYIQYRHDGHNYMRTRHQAGDGRTLTAVKGNPAEVLELCASYETGNGPAELSEADREAIREANADMAGAGQRVLACAYALDGDHAEADGNGTPLVWLGLVGMADPLRPGIKRVIERFHEAGIATVLMTGDQHATAAAIARELGLGGGKQIRVVDANDLEGKDPAALGRILDETQVFARVTPANKLDIVRALQARGQVVSMTGDGVNDSPALKAADIGIAMGHSGTPIARDVAAIVLRDDNLDDMVVAIHRGRTIYRNVRKAIRFLLSTNASEILVMFAATVAGQPAPLTAMQLLWINLATDVFPALGLAMEPPDNDVMRSPPRDPYEPIVRRQDLWRIGRESLMIGGGSLAGYAWGLATFGPGPQAQTVACLSLIAGQLLHAITCRSHRSIFARQPGWRRRNWYLDAALVGTLGLQVLVAAVPALRGFFGFAPLGPIGYAVALAGGLVPFVLNNLLKGREDEEAQVRLLPSFDRVRPTPETQPAAA